MRRKSMNFKKAVFLVDRGLDGLQALLQAEDRIQKTLEHVMYLLVRQHLLSKVRNRLT